MNAGRKHKRAGVAFVFLVLIALLASCGGGGGGGSDNGGGITGTGVVVQGIMAKGSIIVNGVSYDASGANIRKDDSTSTEAELEDGMKVSLRGDISDDGITGTATEVEAEDEVQGRVTNLDAAGNPPSFQVLQQTIYTDDLTVFSNFPGDPDDINDMADDQFVEVHGLRDSSGNIRATRVELLAGAGISSPEDPELKGIVSGLTGTTFFIGSLEIDYSGATIEPANATISNGHLVEVEGTLQGLVLVATKVEREDLEDEQFEPAEGDEFEVEGFVTEFTAHPGDFKVDGFPVRTLSSTEFESGSEADLRNDIKVEAEGHVENGILIVDKIEFKQARVRINAEASAASSTTVTLLGLVIEINDLTEIEPGILPLTAGTFYEIEGFQDTSGNIIAESIESGDSSRNILQAKVIDKNDTANEVTLLEAPASTVVDLNTVTEFKDDEENLLLGGVEAFMDLVTPGSTVVKVRNDDPLLDTTWDQAEIEN